MRVARSFKLNLKCIRQILRFFEIPLYSGEPFCLIKWWMKSYSSATGVVSLTEMLLHPKYLVAVSPIDAFWLIYLFHCKKNSEFSQRNDEIRTTSTTGGLLQVSDPYSAGYIWIKAVHDTQIHEYMDKLRYHDIMVEYNRTIVTVT